jgi:hypothetical protein
MQYAIGIHGQISKEKSMNLSLCLKCKHYVGGQISFDSDSKWKKWWMNFWHKKIRCHLASTTEWYDTCHIETQGAYTDIPPDGCPFLLEHVMYEGR